MYTFLTKLFLIFSAGITLGLSLEATCLNIDDRISRIISAKKGVKNYKTKSHVYPWNWVAGYWAIFFTLCALINFSNYL